MISEQTLRERQEIDAVVDGLTIVDIFDRNAQNHPDKAAIHWKQGEEWRHLTWSDYRAVVHQAAAGLAALGFGAGQFLAIQAANRPEHVIADLGAVHAGGTAVTFYSTLATNQIHYIASNCEATVAILENLEFMKRWEEIKPQLPHLRYVVLMEGAENYETVDWVLSWEDLLAKGRERLTSHPDTIEELRSAITPETLATLIYTSGTTGTPKGVMITQRNVVWTTECIRRTLPLPANPRAVSYLPLAHIAERMATHYLGIYLGGEVWYCQDMTQVLEYVQQARPQIFFAVPRVWEKFHTRLQARFEEDPRKKRLIDAAVAAGLRVTRAAQEGRAPGLVDRLLHPLLDKVVLSKVRHGLGMDEVAVAVTAAAPISPELIYFFRAIGVPLYELYGMSEDSGPATTNRPGKDRIGSVGTAMPGVEVQLADDGEILIRGGNVAPGYFKMPEESAATFDSEGWLHTGDLARMDDDGFIWIVGRKKEIIITAAGKNVAPARIETLVANHPLVAQACTIGDGRPYLTMLLALDPDEAPAWAGQHGLTFTDLASFSQLPEVQAEIQRLVDEANLQVSRVEQIKKFSIVPDTWSPDSGEITPSLKLRRRVVVEKYADLIERMYGD